MIGYLSGRNVIKVSIIAVVLAAVFFASGANVFLCIAILLWVLSLTYLILKGLEKSIVCVCFLLSFFVFLMGREILFSFFDLKLYYRYLATPHINNHTFFCLTLSIMGLMSGFLLSKAFINPRNELYTNNHIIRLRRISKWVFCFFLIPSSLSLLISIRTVMTYGYYASYIAGSNRVPSIVSLLSNMESMPFFIFLSTTPSKKEARPFILTYLTYNSLILLTGKRFQTVSFVMIIVIYLFLRNNIEERWIEKKHIVLGVILIPFALVFLAVYDSIRAGKEASFTSFGLSLMDFFDQIGGSVNVIKRELFYEERLSKEKLYSFSGIYSLVFENKITTSLFGIQVYEGNSIEHALNGHSLSHILSWYDYKERYLSGHGVGSCYIAELYHDFGYFGVVLGSVLYGAVLKQINNMPFQKPYYCAVLFSMLHSLLLAPRGGFDMFINEAFGIKGLLVLFFIFIMDRCKKNN